MKRIRVIKKDGSGFLLHKGETLRGATSWKNAFNKHNKGDQIQAVVQVNQKPKNKRRQSIW